MIPRLPLAGRNSLIARMSTMRWIGLISWTVLCFGVAGIGARWTAGEVRGWYRTLNRPVIAPPNWVFGPVWTLLYALMAVAAWRVWLATPSTARTIGLTLFLVQLALNLAWSWIFFRSHAIGAALAEVVVLWLAIGITALVFGMSGPCRSLAVDSISGMGGLRHSIECGVLEAELSRRLDRPKDTKGPRAPHKHEKLTQPF